MTQSRVAPKYKLEPARTAPRFFIVDDDEVDRLMCKRFLEEGFGRASTIDMASDLEDAIPAIEAGKHDVYIIDYRLGGQSGLDLIRQCRATRQDQVFILLTGVDDRKIDLAATEAGAADYHVKSDLTSSRLERSIRFALSMNAQKRELVKTTLALEAATAEAQAESRKHLALACELEATQDRLRLALDIAKESEAEKRLVLDALPIAIAYIDKDERYVLVNKLASEWYAMPEAELIGRKIEDVHRQGYENLKPIIQAVLAGQTTVSESSITYPDGVTRDVKIYTAPNVGPDGTVLGWYGVTEDISARIQAEKSLSEKASVLETMTKTIPDGLLVFDRELNLAAWNNQIFSVLGLSSDTILGAVNPGKVMRSRVANLGGFGDVRTDDHIALGDDFAFSKDGVQFEKELNNGTWIEYRGFPIDSGEGWVATFRDISERRKLEALKNEFVTTVSHELRTPLTSIFGSLGLARNQTAERLLKDPGQLLDIAYRNCERLVELVNDILDMEKIEAGETEYALTPIDVRDLVFDAIELNTAYGAQLGINFETAETIPDLTVSGNYQGLLQVLANLLSNAAKYSPERGRVVISVERDDEVAVISVRDWGAGISDEYHELIFQKFAKIDAANTAPVPGTGLGLSICQAIIEQHNGEIGVESAPGDGSTFYIKVPLTSSAAESQTAMHGR